MCGIAGIIGENVNVEQLEAMLDKQKHRGPDNKGVYKEFECALGHNRLAIIDLTEAANQPFYSEDRRFVIVFNGELYNFKELKEELKNDYKFKTLSDTEVVLAAFIKWGTACLNRFNGMFAFAIWDTKKKVLFAARDRFGVKPFYYLINDEKLYFASEIKTFFAAGFPKIPNSKVWASYFVSGSYGDPSETFWERVCQLPGGHFLEY